MSGRSFHDDLNPRSGAKAGDFSWQPANAENNNLMLIWEIIVCFYSGILMLILNSRIQKRISSEQCYRQMPCVICRENDADYSPISFSRHKY